MKIIETNLKFKNSMTNRSATKRIILHHAEASKCTAEDIHRWHLNNGWAGAGYHFLVRKDGSVYRLRPENKVGAHAQGANSNSIGICFEGAYMTENMPQAQINAGKELVAYLKNKYGISKVQAHRDVCSTSCPGTNFPFTEIAGAVAVSAPVNTVPKPATSSAAKPATSNPYRNGSTYTLKADALRVRTGAGTNYRAKTYKELSANARKNAYSNGNLKKGTRVTCMATKMIGNDIWMQIPSGWIAARYGGKTYVR